MRKFKLKMFFDWSLINCKMIRELAELVKVLRGKASNCVVPLSECLEEPSQESRRKVRVHP